VFSLVRDAGFAPDKPIGACGLPENPLVQLHFALGAMVGQDADQQRHFELGGGGHGEFAQFAGAAALGGAVVGVDKNAPLLQHDLVAVPELRRAEQDAALELRASGRADDAAQAAVAVQRGPQFFKEPRRIGRHKAVFLAAHQAQAHETVNVFRRSNAHMYFAHRLPS
jgi:hypothetical protein